MDQPLLCKAHLLKTGLTLIWSLMGQSSLLRKAHLLETGLSTIQSLKLGPVSWVSLMGQSHGSVSSARSVSSVAQGSFAGDDSFSGLESLMLNAIL